jgi:hypothetical protein
LAEFFKQRFCVDWYGGGHSTISRQIKALDSHSALKQ